MRILPVPGVFRPLDETWLLAGALADEPVGPGHRVLELCAGSGAVAITAARDRGAWVTTVDVSNRARAAARVNGALNGVRVDARRGDLLGPVAGSCFDAIVANPPYLPALEDDDPFAERQVDAGPDGRLLVDRIIAAAPEHLCAGGVLLVVHSAVTGEFATHARMREVGLAPATVRRQPVPFGPVMTARAADYRRRGLLAPDEDVDTLVVVRGRRPR